MAGATRAGVGARGRVNNANSHCYAEHAAECEGVNILLKINDMVSHRQVQVELAPRWRPPTTSIVFAQLPLVS